MALGKKLNLLDIFAMLDGEVCLFYEAEFYEKIVDMFLDTDPTTYI